MDITLYFEDFQESNMKLVSLSCLKDLLDLEPAKFGPHLSTFVPLWMKLSQDKKQDLKVRIKALECIKVSAKSEGTLVTLMKKEVVKIVHMQCFQSFINLSDS